MELKQYFYLLRKWLWLLVIGGVLGAIAGYVFSILQQPLYQTQTKVMVMRPPEESTNQFYSVYNDLQQVKTYSELIATEPVLEAAGEKLGYEVDAGQISVRQIPDALIFEVTVTDPDPIHAAEIANLLVDSFVIFNDSLQDNRFASSEQSLQTQIVQVEEQINGLQQELTQDTDQSLSSQQEQVKAQISDLEGQILGLQDQIDSNDQNRPELDQILRDQISQLRYLLQLYQQIYVNLQVFGRSNLSNNSLIRNDQLQATLNLYQQIYTNLLNNYENIRLARLRSTPNVVQIETASIPEFPFSPQPLRNAILGAFVGVFFMGGIAFLIEYLDDTLKTPEDVQRLLGLPVIGMIGTMDGGKAVDTVYVADHPRSPVAEAYRTLRTNLDFARVEKPLQTILVTSAEANIGKSTVAANLAVTMAQGDQRVALIDADMRRPNLHRILVVPNRRGLSDIFLSPTPPPNTIQKWGDPAIDFMTSGSLPPNPAELLGSRKMEQILTDLKKVTDTVILDGPPFIVSDPIVLSAKVDGVLVVIKPGSTRIGAAQAMLEQLNRAGARVVGIVFNPISQRRAGYYGAEYYSGTSYGHTSEYEEDLGYPLRKKLKKRAKTSSSQTEAMN